jgi:cystathionine beta-synthase
MGMEKFDQSVIDVIGDTPIVKLQNIASHLKSEIYLKLEYMNPGGSIKERIAVNICRKAIERGDLKPGGTIIEGTSGNTGVGLAMFAAVHGYKAIFVLPDKQSIEKINNLRAFGAKVIVTPTNVEPDDPQSYYSVAKRLAETTPNSFYANQYNNLDNREAHYYSTGPEIFEQTNGEFDVFVSGVGTGGTISGTGKYLKEKMPNVTILGVDIDGSILAPYFHTGEVVEARGYVLEGIGEDIFPENLDFKMIDDMVTVYDKESFVMARQLLTKEGVYTGGSAGAAVVGAIRYAEKLEAEGKDPVKMVVIMCDSGNRYTGKIFNDDWMRDKGYWDHTFNATVDDALSHLGKGTKPLISIDDDKTVSDAVKLFKDHGISQIPVYSKGNFMGMISESNVLRPLFEGKYALGDNLSIAIDRDFVVVKSTELLDNVAKNLMEHKTVLVEKDDKLVEILTDIDVLNFMSYNSF